MKRKHIKLSTAGARGLLATLLIAGASLTNTSYTPKHESPEPYQIKNNPDKKLERIDFNYNLQDKSYKTTDFSTDSDTVLLARLVFGEARGSSLKEKVSTAYTAVNRANDSIDWNGKNLREAILKGYQYSCFNYNDPNRIKLMDPMEYDSTSWKESMKAAKGVLDGTYRDPTGGATHYHTKKIYPYWMKSNEITKVDHLEDMDHNYYRPSKEQT